MFYRKKYQSTDNNILEDTVNKLFPFIAEISYGNFLARTTRDI